MSDTVRFPVVFPLPGQSPSPRSPGYNTIEIRATFDIPELLVREFYRVVKDFNSKGRTVIPLSMLKGVENEHHCNCHG